MLTITINCENDAFGTTVGDTAEEIARILNKLATQIVVRSYEFVNDEQDIHLYDINGNKVGTATYTNPEE